MLELINTSLPNGLISGTHGFSTVAMTHGVSDIIRGRLEPLCAYKHRNMKHDETYFKENPINWFHVELMQGEHVVGVVAPSEFDYTGRTNRLAKLRVFTKSEMPRVGGTQILDNEKEWYLEKWYGEPRYLPENDVVCKKLQLLTNLNTKKTQYWEKYFGKNGSLYAQQIANYLIENINIGFKPIYFKTSVSWDVSGEKLLSLYSEIIELLPLSLKSKITFSTYSVAIPDGIVCHFKGIYDNDKVFEAISHNQFWVDCVNGQILNYDLLPKMNKSYENIKKITETDFQKINNYNNEVISKSQKQPKEITNNKAIEKKSDYKSLIEENKNKPDVFVITIITIAIFVVLFVLLAFGYEFLKNKENIEEYKTEDTKELPIENNKEEQSIKEEKSIKEEVKKRTIEDKDKESLKPQENAKEKSSKNYNEIKKENIENKSPEFLTAKHVKYWTKDFIEKKKNFEIKVFYYEGNQLTNDFGGFNQKKNPFTGKIELGEEKIGKNSNDCSIIKKSPLAIWLLEDTVWYDWEHKDNKGEKWFKDKKEQNLTKLCFGENEDVYKKWKEVYTNITYKIKVVDQNISDIEVVNKDIIKKDEIVNEIFKEITLDSKKTIENLNNLISKNKTEISKKEKELNDLEKSLADEKNESSKNDDKKIKEQKKKNESNNTTTETKIKKISEEIEDYTENIKKYQKEIEKEEQDLQEKLESKYKLVEDYLFSVKVKGN